MRERETRGSITRIFRESLVFATYKREEKINFNSAVAKTHRGKGNCMPIQSVAGGHRLLAMTVHNIGFLLDRLGQDCHPLQFVRELTKNSIEAIERSGSDGVIVWDYEPVAFELNGVRRLCIVDTGDGMTGEEMVKFINQLSSSVSKQSLQGTSSRRPDRPVRIKAMGARRSFLDALPTYRRRTKAVGNKGSRHNGCSARPK
ncbi:MAG: hypothetical protein DME49_13540 [Verrucomicrobia bacterium]|nr:MAG: hypothetical protein DME49_13540 [Verrucomicrobiota bacterium]